MSFNLWNNMNNNMTGGDYGSSYAMTADIHDRFNIDYPPMHKLTPGSPKATLEGATPSRPASATTAGTPGAGGAGGAAASKEALIKNSRRDEGKNFGARYTAEKLPNLTLDTNAAYNQHKFACPEDAKFLCGSDTAIQRGQTRTFCRRKEEECDQAAVPEDYTNPNDDYEARSKAIYENKYLKYKTKYLQLKKQLGL